MSETKLRNIYNNSAHTYRMTPCWNRCVVQNSCTSQNTREEFFFLIHCLKNGDSTHKVNIFCVCIFFKIAHYRLELSYVEGSPLFW